MLFAIIRPPSVTLPPGSHGGGIGLQKTIAQHYGMYLDVMFSNGSPRYQQAVAVFADLYAAWPTLQTAQPHPTDGRPVEFTPSAMMKSIAGANTLVQQREALDLLYERAIETFDLSGTLATEKMLEVTDLYLESLQERAIAPRPAEGAPLTVTQPPRTVRGTEILFQEELPYRATEPASSAPRTQRGTDILPQAPRVIQRPTMPLPPAEMPALPPTPEPSRALQTSSAPKQNRFRILSWFSWLRASFIKWVRSR